MIDEELVALWREAYRLNADTWPETAEPGLYVMPKRLLARLLTCSDSDLDQAKIECRERLDVERRLLESGGEPVIGPALGTLIGPLKWE